MYPMNSLSSLKIVAGLEFEAWFFTPLIFHLTGLGQNAPNVGTELRKKWPKYFRYQSKLFGE